MSFFKNKENLLVLCVVALVLFLSFGKDLTSVRQQTALANLPEETVETEIASEVFVHITGRVKQPGVYRLLPGSRLQDAVEAAGGLESDADTSRVNLSLKLKDEDKFHIPAVGETAGEIRTDGLVEDGLVDINYAEQKELEGLPGIGPALALRIIEYRDNTPFVKIEDIQNVRGIGEKLFDGMKEQIIVR